MTASSVDAETSLYVDSATFSERFVRAPGIGVISHPRDAVPQNPKDWLMRLCKRLKTLSFTVNSGLKVNSLTTPPVLFIVIKITVITLPGDRDASDLLATLDW
jgi:hypothetical protein